jgi:preprotein translocase subunit SecD
MNALAKNWKILILLAALLLSFFSIAASGIKLGTDFSGGTLFQIHLSEEATGDQMQIIRSVIEQRMDSFGLKDTSVSPAGNEFLIAKIAESDPEELEAIEKILRTQGKFEVLLDGNVLFTGSDIIQIVSDPAHGYSVYGEGESFRWVLPFVLKESAAEKFSRGVFHKCIVTGYGSGGNREYDCEKTYFFIDRPSDAVLVMPEDVYASDSDAFFAGSVAADIPRETSMEEFLLNSDAEYIIADSTLTEEQREKLTSLVSERAKAVVPPTLAAAVKEELTAMGYTVKELSPQENVPWLWTAAGGKAVISLTAGITNDEPYVSNPENARAFSRLTITGTAGTKEEAYSELSSLRIILETGSLPIGIDDISKEVVSPLLGIDFLNIVLLMGVAALIAVSLSIFIRYRQVKLTIPILFIALSEVVIVLGFASLIRWNLDLAAVAGIIAAVGTGVDDQIIITDELMRKEEVLAGSLLNRIKKAFFIIFAAACTTIATMSPILIFGFGLGKLTGFALTTIAGVLIGVLITRPAFSEIVKAVIEKSL